MTESAAIVVSSDGAAIHRWELLFVSTCKIQRAYRKYLMRSVGLSVFKVHSRNEFISEPKSAQPFDLGKILKGSSTNDEKLETWRYVIEIRKVRPQYSTDACLRSLIECGGDLQRTLIVTGNAEFRHRNSDDLPHHQREILLPRTAIKTQSDSLRQSASNPPRGGFRDLRKLKNDKTLLDGVSTSHRNDRSRFDLSDTMTKIYFSKP